MMNFRSLIGVEAKDEGAGQGLPPGTPLVRQSSIYSLTFDEFQNTTENLGKDFGSMNMDEFLKNIWTAEESQAMAVALGGIPCCGTSDAAAAAGLGLQRQGSLTLPRTLSQKTVDEVWRDLANSGQGSSGLQGGNSHPQRQPTLGEMTLEEFLVRAGVVREEFIPAPPRPSAITNSSSAATNNAFYGSSAGLALGFHHAGQSSQTVLTNPVSSSSAANLAMTVSMTRPYAPQLPQASNVDLRNPQGGRGGELVSISDAGINNALMPGVVGMGTGGVTLSMGSPVNPLSSDGNAKGNSDLSSVSPVPYVFNEGLRGRKCSGAVEKVMERRQRRMIKNRESAARSRARKQAYTMELEAEVAKLKEQNAELVKKKAELIEMQKNQVMKIISEQHVPKKQCLRRTLTGPW